MALGSTTAPERMWAPTRRERERKAIRNSREKKPPKKEKIQKGNKL